jgi:3-methyladenine DNA glycosylase/8-oxoguanine DNA glycosylase
VSALAAPGPAVPPAQEPPGPVAGGAVGGGPAPAGSVAGGPVAGGPVAGGPVAGGAAGVPPDAVGEWRAPFTLDVPRTLGVHRRGGGDPAFRVAADGSIWRTALTPEGPGTIRVAVARPAAGAAGPAPETLRPAPEAAGPAPGTAGPLAAARGPAVTVVRGSAWGPGASWLLRTLPAALGADDDPAGFDPVHRVLSQLARRHRGLRIGRTGLVMEALVPAVLEQKVTGVEAHRAWRLLLLKFGLPAPGPVPRGMRVCPPPLTWRRIPSWEWHRAGVEAVRARTIIGACRVAGRLEEITAMSPAAADRRLQSLPGIGPWTSAEIRQRACGDPDAVSVGDLHLPGQVGWALTGRVVDDAGMLELLAPYQGHRHRAASLVVAARIGPPRRAPRMPIRDFRRI